MSISARIRAAAAAFSAVQHFYFESRYAERRLAPGISDLRPCPRTKLLLCLAF